MTTMPKPVFDRLPTLAELKTIRRLIAKSVWNGPSNGQCIRTTVILASIFGGKIQAGWKYGRRGGVAGGERARFQDGGYFDGTKWQDHYWLLKEGKIIDLTADQFGGDKIIIASPSDERFRHTASIRLITRDTFWTIWNVLEMDWADARKELIDHLS